MDSHYRYDLTICLCIKHFEGPTNVTFKHCLDTISALTSWQIQLVVSCVSAADHSNAVFTGKPFIQLLTGHGGGIYKAWETVLPEAQSHYITFIGDGDLMQAPFVERSLELLTSHAGLGPSVDIICGEPWFYDSQRPPKPRRSNKRKHRITSRFLPRSYICHSGAIISKRCYENLFVGYDADLKILRDLSFLLRLRRSKAIYRYLDIPQVHFMSGGISNARGLEIERLKERVTAWLRVIRNG